MKKRFGLKEAILGTFLASAGCVGEEVGGVDVEKLGEKQKIIRIEKDVQPESDSEFFVPEDDKGIDGLHEARKVEDPKKNVQDTSDVVEDSSSAKATGDRHAEEDLSKEDVESQTEQDIEDTLEQKKHRFINILEQEGYENKGKCLDSTFDMVGEANRINPKLKDWMFEDKFNSSLEQAEKYLIKFAEGNENLEEIREAVFKYCDLYGGENVNECISVVMGLIGVESGGDQSKVSKRDAFGVMQIRDVTFGQTKKDHHDEDWSGVNIKENTKDNIRVGVRFLCDLHERYGDWNFALMAYNRGRTGFEKDFLLRWANFSKNEKLNRDDIEDWSEFFKQIGVNIIFDASINGQKSYKDSNAVYAFAVKDLSEVFYEVMMYDGDDLEGFIKELVEKHFGK